MTDKNQECTYMLHGFLCQNANHPRTGEGTSTKILLSDLIVLGTAISGTSSYPGLALVENSYST